MRARIGQWLSSYLTKPLPGLDTLGRVDPERLKACLRPGDVLLVEGNARISSAIKYLTQSTWSHSALYVGAAYAEAGGGPHGLIEADIQEGVRRLSLDTYVDLHCRICRPVGLNDDETRRVIDFAGQRLGMKYDLRHIFDLARYLMPMPPVPTRWRRHMLVLGSGDPTRAICSTLLAQAFQSIDYPILPRVALHRSCQPGAGRRDTPMLYPRHYSLFVPRDFDVSPYFSVIKPTLDRHFNYRQLIWGEEPSASTLEAGGRAD